MKSLFNTNERMKDFLLNGKKDLLDFTDIYSTNRIGLHNNIHSLPISISEMESVYMNGVGLHDKFYKEKTTI